MTPTPAASVAVARQLLAQLGVSLADLSRHAHLIIKNSTHAVEQATATQPHATQQQYKVGQIGQELSRGSACISL